MKNTLAAIVIIATALAFGCGRTEETSLAANREATIGSKLRAYDHGTIGLEEVTGSGVKSYEDVIDYYLVHSNGITAKMKLPISRCFAAADRYEEAVDLARDYSTVYSNDWRGWKILGAAYLGLLNYSNAIPAFTNAAKLGDDGSYVPLAFAALKNDQLDLVGETIPRLLVLKEKSPAPGSDPLDAVVVLIVYSLKTHDQEIFIRALTGLDAKQIMSRDDLGELVTKGCSTFSGAEIEHLCQQLRAIPNATPTH